MSSFQKGLCPVCHVSVQVKNFRRQWNTSYERHERTRTYNEVFNTLKANILDQDKTVRTTPIETLFESKRRRVRDATTSTENSIVHNINRDLTVNDNIIVNDVLISLYDLISDIDNNRIENENYDTTLCMNSISTIVVQDTHQNIYDNEVSCSFAYPPINRPTCIKISLPGVRFITDQELKFVDEQRLLLNDNTWFLKGVIDKSKSSRSWFTEA
ncbi:unnamed protein product, partial [Rotaria magnacalcarata]